MCDFVESKVSKV